MIKYRTINSDTIAKLKTVYYSRYIWAYKNEISWFVMLSGYDKDHCESCEFRCVGGLSVVSSPTRTFTEEIIYKKECVEKTGMEFILYRFDNFIQFATYYSEDYFKNL